MPGPRGKRSRIRELKRKGKKIDARFLAQCSGKIKYDSYEAAKAAADAAINCHAYKCDYCGHYHKGRIKK